MNREAILARAESLGAQYRLAPPRAIAAGGAGVFAGARDGQSVDFHDYREYTPGDDPRRVDWRAYARNGQMQIKLFREEVSPSVEIHLDTSPGMAAYAGKEAAAIFLAAFLRRAALNAEARPSLHRDGGRFGGADFPAALLHTKFGQENAAKASKKRPAPQARNALRFFLSDYLTPDDLPARIALQASGSLSFTPVMLLSESELRPPWRGATRLRDIENESRRLDIVIGEAELAAYRKRLAAHRANVEALARTRGGKLIAVETPDTLHMKDGKDGADETLFPKIARQLAREGVVTPC